MKIHLRYNYMDKDLFKDSPHMFSAIEKGNYAVCGKLTRNGYITDDITKVECKMCKQIDELNFVRGEN